MTNNKVLPFDDHDTIQAEAREWLIRLDRDDPPSKAEVSALRQWADQSRAHHSELVRISQLWNDANILNELSTPVYDRATVTWRDLIGKLYAACSPTTKWAAAAASAVLAVALSISLLPPPITHTNGLYITAIGEVQEQRLVDGSVLQLNTDSQVQVSYNEGVRKIRLLKGEAHFEVTSDPQWPFQVYAGDGMVKAVGTAFSVRLNPEQVNVIVSEGIVDIASVAPIANSDPSQANSNNSQANSDNSQANSKPTEQKLASLAMGQTTNIPSIYQSPNQTAAPQVIKTIPTQELERKLAWRTGYLVLAGDPLSQVINEISRYTPISIQMANPEMADIRVGGRFKVGELDAMLEVLETSFGLQISYLDDHRIQLRPAQ